MVKRFFDRATYTKRTFREPEEVKSMVTCAKCGRTTVSEQLEALRCCHDCLATYIVWARTRRQGQALIYAPHGHLGPWQWRKAGIVLFDAFLETQ